MSAGVFHKGKSTAPAGVLHEEVLVLPVARTKPVQQATARLDVDPADPIIRSTSQPSCWCCVDLSMDSARGQCKAPARPATSWAPQRALLTSRALAAGMQCQITSTVLEA